MHGDRDARSAKVLMLYESLWSLYERYLLEEDNLSEYMLGEKKAKVKQGLIDALLSKDRGSAEKRIGRATAMINEVTKALNLMKANVLEVDAELTYRGLFGSSQGLGNVVLEVGLTWDPLLDVPIVPGSSFKGVVRNFCVMSLVKSGLELRKAEDMCSALLGGTEKNGHIALASFLDAVPVRLGKHGGLLEADVLNPHYNALTNKDLRTELDVVPSPVTHLCVGEGVVFRFTVYVPYRAHSTTPARIHDVEELANLLNIPSVGDASARALLTVAHLVGGALRLGIGARTLKGYGRFKVVSHRVRIHV